MTSHLFSKLILLLLSFILLSCQQKVKRLEGESITYEIPLTEIYYNSKYSNNKGDAKSYAPYYTPPIYLVNDYLYISSNGFHKRVLKFDKNALQLLAIGENNNPSNVSVVIDGKKGQIPPQEKSYFTPFSFDFIINFFPAQNGDIYVMNLALPKDNEKLEPAPFKRKRQPVNNKKEPAKPYPEVPNPPQNIPTSPQHFRKTFPGQSEPIVQNVPVAPITQPPSQTNDNEGRQPEPVSNTTNQDRNAKQPPSNKLMNAHQPNIPYSRYIFKFDANGKFLYKIGVKGKNSSPFTKSQMVILLQSDQNGYLYLIVKDSPNPKQSLGSGVYHLYRFSPSGELDFYIQDLAKYLPKDKGFISQIESFALTPVSEKLLLLATYYYDKKKGGIRSYEYKKLVALNLKEKSFNAKLIKLLGDKHKFYSLLGATENDEIYMRIPSDPYPEKHPNTVIYSFQVIDSSGGNIEVKSIVLKRDPENMMNWFLLGAKGEVIVYTQINDLIKCHLYK